MPIGVEHIVGEAPGVTEDKVFLPVMPIGVEHRKTEDGEDDFPYLCSYL